MGKDVGYFTHDYDSHHDPKILMLRAKYGMTGYGSFWVLIELMATYDDPYLDLKMTPALALTIGCEEEWLKEFIQDCIGWDLFVEKDGTISSRRMLSHKQERQSLRDRGAMGADKRWHGRAIAKPSPGDSQLMQRKTKENKTKENKTKESNTMSGCTRPGDGIYDEIINDLNAVMGTKYTSRAKDTRSHIQARLKEGHDLEAFKKVHRTMKAEWGNDEKMCLFLRPQTLYGTKFEAYLNRVKRQLSEDEKILEKYR